jgi:hypothetical protein
MGDISTKWTVRSQTVPGGSKANEDRIKWWVKEGFVFGALLDGASSLPHDTNLSSESLHWMLDHLLAGLESCLGDAPLDLAIAKCLRETSANFHGQFVGLEPEFWPISTLLIVRLDLAEESMDCVALGDSSLVIVREEGKEVVFERRKNEHEARLTSLIGRFGKNSKDVAFNMRQRRLQQTMSSVTAVITMNTTATFQFDIRGCALRSASSICLLSDGATRLSDEYELVSLGLLVDLLMEKGPTLFLLEIRALEDEIASGSNSWKRLDDASVILFERS